jgi:hypothetical protein
MNTIEALKAAYLAGFNASGDGYNGEYPFSDRNKNPEHDADWAKARYDAIDSILQSIKQEEQQPVPVKTYSGGTAWPVQTEWVGLTDDERRVLSYSCDYDDYHELVKNVEAKLKEKNSKG